MEDQAVSGRHLPRDGSRRRCDRTYAIFTDRQEGFHGFFTGRPEIAIHFSAVLQHPQEPTIMATSQKFRITLSSEQKDQVRKVTGKDAEAIELSVEELEERIAPAKRGAWPL